MVHPLDSIYYGGELAAAPRDFRLSHKGGKNSVLIEARISANRDEATLLGIILVFSDVTMRRKAEEEVQLSKKMHAVTAMASGLGRDLARSQSQMNFSLGRMMADTWTRGQFSKWRGLHRELPWI